jgi:hypothetical protein
MRNAFLLFFVIIFGISCVSPKKQMDRGNYDAAINSVVRKLKKNPKKDKNINILERSYTLANRQDNERLSFIKLEGSPDKWDEVFNIYTRLKRRQALVNSLPPLKLSSGRHIRFEQINYDEEIITSKRKAAEFYYTRGSNTLEKGGRMNARAAHDDFMNVKRFFNDYKDVDKKLSDAIFEGTSYVLFKMENASGVPLPPAFEDDLLKISLNDLNRKWLQYHTSQLKDHFYDYVVLVNIRRIEVSPEALKEVHFSESREIEDGSQYVFDDKGNVMKDSLGNDIKVPKFKVITCNLIETQQNKTARIGGTIDFINNENRQLLKSDPITSDFFFNHSTLLAVGDLNALKPETKKRVGGRPLPFPPDPEMIMQSGNILKGMTKNILLSNRRIFE